MNKYLTSNPSALDVQNAEQTITDRLTADGRLQAQGQVLTNFKQMVVQHFPD